MPSDSDIDSDIINSDISEFNEGSNDDYSGDGSVAELDTNQRRIADAKRALAELEARGQTIDDVNGEMSAQRMGAGIPLAQEVEAAAAAADAAGMTTAELCNAQFVKSHSDAPTCVTVDASGRFAVSCGRDGRIVGYAIGDPAEPPRIMWRIKSAPALRRGTPHPARERRRKALARPLDTFGPHLGHYGAVHAVALSSDGHYLVSGGVDGFVLLWDMTTLTLGRPTLLMAFCAHSHVTPGGAAFAGVRSLSFAPHSEYFFSAGGDMQVHVFHAGDRAHIRTLFGPAAAATCVAAASDDRAVVVGEEPAAYILRATSATKTTYTAGRTYGPLSEACAPCDPYCRNFLTAGSVGNVALWSAQKAHPIAEVALGALAAEEESEESGEGYSEDYSDVVGTLGGQLVMGGINSDDEEAVALANRRTKAKHPAPPAGDDESEAEETSQYTFAPTDAICALTTAIGTDLAISGCASLGVVLWAVDPSSDDPLRPVLQLPLPDAAPGYVNSVAVGVGGRVVAAAVGRDYSFGRWAPRREGAHGVAFYRLPVDPAAAGAAARVGLQQESAWGGQFEAPAVPLDDSDESDFDFLADIGMNPSGEEEEEMGMEESVEEEKVVQKGKGKGKGQQQAGKAKQASKSAPAAKKAAASGKAKEKNSKMQFAW